MCQTVGGQIEMTTDTSRQPPEPMSGNVSAPRSKHWLWACLLVVCTLLAYQQAWRAGFIWDDDAHLTKNPCIVGPLGFAGIWTTSAATYYPLTLTSFWIQHALWGLNPTLYHLVNVLMHAASAVVLFAVLRKLAIPGALLAAGIWALHPVQVESVAWITELKNTQSCFFYLLAILFFLKWRDLHRSGTGGNEGRYGVALLCAICAILSKSSTVMLPVVLGLCWWWQERRWRWSYVIRLAPFLIISLAASAWTIWEQKHHSGALGPEWNQTLAERIIIAGKVIWFYLGKLAWPHPLVFIYPRWEINAREPAAYLPFAAATLAFLVLWWRRQRWARPAFFASAYFLVSLVPVLGFFDVYFFRYSFVGDHLQYLASIGPLALAAAGLTLGFDSLRKSQRFVRPAVSGLLLLALGVLSWQQSAMYANEETLWQTTVAKNPKAWIAHNNLGRLDRVEEAVGHYTKAIALNPFFAEAHNNLATAFMKTGRIDEALAEFQRALELDPLYADAYHNLGNALLLLDRPREAIPHYQRSLRLEPGDADAAYNLGVALLATGRGAQAATQFHRALEIDPANSDAGQNLAWLLATHPDESLRDGKRAVALAEHVRAASTDSKTSVYAVLAAAYAEEGRFPDAVRVAEEGLAIATAPDDQSVADGLRAQLAAYREGKPWRDNSQAAH